MGNSKGMLCHPEPVLVYDSDPVLERRQKLKDPILNRKDGHKNQEINILLLSSEPGDEAFRDVCKLSFFTLSLLVFWSRIFNLISC